MIRALLSGIRHIFKPERSACCNAPIRNCYFELGYKKTECTNCYTPLQRLWVI